MADCKNCRRPIIPAWNVGSGGIRGRCHPCYTFWRRNGRDSTELDRKGPRNTRPACTACGGTGRQLATQEGGQA